MADSVHRDTGLTEAQQAQRALLAWLWARRVTFLMKISGCSARDALRAVEADSAEVRRETRQHDI